MSRIYVIGCGGVGSWLAPSLALLVGHEHVTLIDGDQLETKNLNRQLFTPLDLGLNKAIALADRYQCQSIPKFYSYLMIEHADTDWIFCCADNNPARVAVLQACVNFKCQAIFGANEHPSAEGYYYHPQWIDGPLDPRVYYPEMLTDLSDNPLARSAGCTGEVQKRNPQLVSANFMAAALCQHPYVFWGMEIRKLDGDSTDPKPFPYKLVSNLSRLETHRIGDKL